MPLYLSRFSYTPETWARLIGNPEDRREAARSYIESVGGKLHGFWYAFGTHDGYNLWEAPDNVSMAAVASQPPFMRLSFQDAVAIGARVCGARPAASNFSVSWVPSQNGFVPEPPQRQRKIVVCSVRSYSFPSASTTLAGPSIT
jgi:hypothetical protein